MFVCLTSCGPTTRIISAESFNDVQLEDGWQLVLALDVPKHMVSSIVSKWKRESRGEVSRVRKAFLLADNHMLNVHISNSDVGILKKLKEYSGNPKNVPDSFWNNL